MYGRDPYRRRVVTVGVLALAPLVAVACKKAEEKPSDELVALAFDRRAAADAIPKDQRRTTLAPAKSGIVHASAVFRGIEQAPYSKLYYVNLETDAAKAASFIFEVTPTSLAQWQALSVGARVSFSGRVVSTYYVWGDDAFVPFMHLLVVPRAGAATEADFTPSKYPLPRVAMPDVGIPADALAGVSAFRLGKKGEGGYFQGVEAAFKEKIRQETRDQVPMVYDAWPAVVDLAHVSGDAKAFTLSWFDDKGRLFARLVLPCYYWERGTSAEIEGNCVDGPLLSRALATRGDLEQLRDLASSVATAATRPRSVSFVHIRAREQIEGEAMLAGNEPVTMQQWQVAPSRANPKAADTLVGLGLCFLTQDNDVDCRQRELRFGLPPAASASEAGYLLDKLLLSPKTASTKQ